MQIECAASGREVKEMNNEGKYKSKLFIACQTLFTNMIYFLCLSGIKALEKKAFEVCDVNGDGSLSWKEVEECEVR